MKLPLPALIWYAKHGPFAAFRHSALLKISRGYNGVDRHYRRFAVHATKETGEVPDITANIDKGF